jgi:hypothetical protein
MEMLVRFTTALLERRGLEYAAKECGVHVATAYRWQQRGRNGDARYGPLAQLVKEAKRGRPIDLGLTMSRLRGDFVQGFDHQ